MSPRARVVLPAAIALVACARASVAPPPAADPAPPVTRPVAAPATVTVPSAPPPEPVAPVADAADAAADPCEGAELDLDALHEAGRCPLPEQRDAARTDPDVVARIDAATLDVAPGATLRVPVVFENPTSHTLALQLRGCADEGTGPGAGLLGIADAAAPPRGLSPAFALSVENAAGKRADEAPGDNVACLVACPTLGVLVHLPPGAHARATVVFKAEMHRWSQCEREPAGPLRRGTYQLIVTGADNHRATARLVVH